MTPQDRFAELMARAPGQALELSAPFSDEEALLEIDGRVFHFWLSPKREEITISTPICFSGEDESFLHSDLIADFNAFFLFKGGYRLCIDPLTKSVYVSVVKALGRLQSSGLPKFIEDFVPRCANCSRWYMNEAFRRAA